MVATNRLDKDTDILVPYILEEVDWIDFEVGRMGPVRNRIRVIARVIDQDP